MELKNYLDDGADWQAQCVLAYLRSCYSYILDRTFDKEKHRLTGTIEVGRYENYREQGYVFTISYMSKYRSYAVYEHRNSDNLCVLIADGLCTLNTPNVDEMWSKKPEGSTKYDVDASFNCGSIVDCGEWVVEDMRAFINDIIDGTDTVFHFVKK